MSKYFTFFPTTKYKVANSSFSIEKVVKNITLKTDIIEGLSQDDPYLYLKYTVKEGERAEDVSEFYYGSTKYVWLVYMSNDIIDPYSQWPKEFDQFQKYLNKKYASQAGSTEAVYWTQNTGITENIIHYKNNVDEVTLISPDSYTLAQTFNDDFVAGEWSAVRYYEYELDLNEQQRNINLINDRYVDIAENNLKGLLNGR